MYRVRVAVLACVMCLTFAAPAAAITLAHAEQVANSAIHKLGKILARRYHQNPTSYHGRCHLQGSGARCPFNIHFKSGKVCHSTVIIKEPGDKTGFGKVHCVH